MFSLKLASIAILLFFALWRHAVAETEVDVELVLAVDVSRSMSAGELEIQRRGYAEAIRDPQVVKAISEGLVGRIAVTYLEWAGDGNQRVVVPWMEIANMDDAQSFSARLVATSGFTMRYTSISGALLTATRLFEGNGFAGLKKVIDVSGDGPNNQGVPVEEARDLALGNNIVINGLPLMTNEGGFSRFSIPNLDKYYTDCVIGGPGSFSLPVRSWEEFPEAVRRKLVLELAGYEMPETGRIPVVKVQSGGDGNGDKFDCLIGERLRLQWDGSLQ